LEDNTLKTRSIKFNFIMNAILTVSQVLFPLITFPYISRVLRVEGSGVVAFATSVITYFTMFATLGVPTYGIRACARVRDDREKLSQTVQELLIISGITTIITYAVFFAMLFCVPKFAAQKELLMVVGVSIGLTTIGVQWFYNALEQYSYITVCSIVFKLIGLVLMVLFVKNPEDYIVYGVVYVIGNFGAYVLNFLRLRKFITFRKQGSYALKEHFRGTMLFFLLSAATSVYLNLDIVMLGFMKNDTEVGYYNAAIKVKNVLVTGVTSLGTVLLPRLSYYVQKKEKTEFQRTIAKAFEFVLLIATSVMVYFMIYAEESVLLLAGKDFLPAVVSMVILMPTVLLIGLSNITGMQILTPQGEETKVVYSVAAGAVLDFVFNLLLIPKYGAAGAAVSTLMAEFLVILVQGFYLREELGGILKKIQFWKIGLGLALASVSAVLLQIYVHTGEFTELLISAVIFFGIFFLTLVLVKEKFVREFWDMGVEFVRSRGRRG
jgi:O-antigen/teichoic acid export membrane protein